MVATYPTLRRIRSAAYQGVRELVYRSGLPVVWPGPFGLSRGLIETCRSARGIIHVGANSGQERFLYDYLRKPILWIEPDNESFRRLRKNIRNMLRQRAILALCWNKDGARVPFHPTSNNGLSSSVYPLARHQDLWPEVKPNGRVMMTTRTLDRILFPQRRKRIPYDTLVLDTQGSELQILRGAGKTLAQVQTIVCEACNFEAYRGGCRAGQIRSFLRRRGWQLFHSLPVWRSGTKTYFELIFRKSTAG